MALSTADDLARAWDAAEILYEQRLPGGVFVISRQAGAGYGLDHPYYGRFLVVEDGSQIACAPADLPAWLWQRFLIGQLIPLAALLHGYEPLHASAVGMDGRALLVLGPTGAGKSSVALHMAAAGAAFMTDDVSVLELHDGAVIAHPGPALASVDSGELARLPAEVADRWERLGVAEGEQRVVLGDTDRHPLRVGAVYVLARRSDIGLLTIGLPSMGSAELLLGATFNAYLRDPPRLTRQLEMVGHLAETVPVLEVRVPLRARASDVATAILSYQPTTASARRETP